ncbi:MAG: hypothetical protein GF398_15950 [Chitinivibrionales bacterium]|nr:hypothetical protein [Chitinivibrionales bacterium]
MPLEPFADRILYQAEGAIQTVAHKARKAFGRALTYDASKNRVEIQKSKLSRGIYLLKCNLMNTLTIPVL